MSFSISFFFYLALFACYVIVVWLTPDRSPTSHDQQPSGEDRFSRVATGLFLCWWVSFFLPFFTTPWFVLPLWPSTGIGFSLFVLGIVVRMTAIRTLGHFFTYQLCIREQHALIRHGIYRYIRHPSYTGTLLEAIGMLLVARSLYGLILFGLSAFVLFYMRIQREEQMMLDHFGDDYLRYKEQSWRLIPWVF